MAHPNSNKFVSVNLNKSYGRPSPNPRSSRPSPSGPHHHSSGGMVVLSRPRSSSAAAAPKLSVPAPLNLPSLRKEHEKLDLSSSSGPSARPGSSGIGSGSGSSSVGWIKNPTATSVAAAGAGAPHAPANSGGYVPPTVRAGPGAVEKAVFLRGEDFPSLKAATLKKEKEEERKVEVSLSLSSSSPLRMRPQTLSSSGASRVSNNVSSEKEESKKKGNEEKYFPGPLPIVRLSHTSDWADDERDTGLNLPERDREVSYGEIGGGSKGDSFGLTKDVVNSWRTPPSKPLGVSNVGNGRRDLGYGNNGNNNGGENGKSVGGRYGGDGKNDKYMFQNNAAQGKLPFSYGMKGGLSLNDPILNFSREKRGVSSSGNGGKSVYLGDAGFDVTDPFTDDPIEDLNMKVFKRKMEVQKQAEFHDPVRESFEAELERVQRIQEQERQRAMEEQARAMEFAWREQEEREKLVREEKDRRRRIEEQAREAAWRVEQEKMEAVSRVEEQKIAREEEKRRTILEEERRKEAARQKLMELEAKMSKRQSESSQKDDKIPSDVVGDWEDGERMVEHITSTSSDSSINRYFDTNSSRFPPVQDASSSSMERGKYANYWKKDSYENGHSSIFYASDQESEYHNLRRDAFGPNRGFPKRENYGPSPNSSMPDDLRYMRGNRGWNVGGGDGDHFTRNMDVEGGEFLDTHKFGDGGWGGYGRPRGSPNNPYSERPFQNPEVDGGFPPYGRSRHSLRQPRVHPPPSISSMRQTQNTLRSVTDQSRYQNDDGFHQRVQQPRTPELLESNSISLEQKEEEDSPRCDSQSSLSVSNPPSSPTQLSHDDLDEAEDSQALKTSVDEHLVSDIEEAENMNTLEDDEWVVENSEEMQEQEEYDEEDDGYHEEAEAAHDDDFDGSPDMGRQLNHLTSDVVPNAATGEMGQLLLGFDEGVEVSIPINNDLEKTSQNFEKSIEVQNDSQIDNSHIEVAKSEPSIIETEMALQKLVLDPVPLSTSNPLDSSHENKVLEKPIHPTSITRATSSTVSTVDSQVDSQSEAPIRLQFGLFSGPSLIPSPVPAIQIGSIQMPLHLHAQVGTSITQMHPSQPPFFQFGQLRYPTPISQGILPLSPQPVSFVHPPTQSLGSCRHINQVWQESSSSQNNLVDKVTSVLGEGQAGLLKQPLDPSQENSINQPNSEVIHDVAARRNYKPVISSRDSQAQSGTKALGIISTSQGKRFTYTVRNAATRSSFPMLENTRSDSSGFQRRPRRSVRRTEFRVRENLDKRQGEGMEPNNAPHFSSRSGTSGRYGARKDATLNKSSQNLSLGASTSQLASSDGKVVIKDVEVSTKKRVSSLEHARNGGENEKRQVSTEEDVDAPLQSGVVRVFKQAGIEAPSDEDDFIEVRSKRQMLNDRREQREKEIKAKSKVIKAPRKYRVVPQSSAVTLNPTKAIASSGGNMSNNARSHSVIAGGRGFARVEFSANKTSQNLPPIGIPPVKVDTDARSSNNLKHNQVATIPVTTSAATKFVPSLSFDGHSPGLLNASLPLDSWSNPDINQQVMALTQSQLDDAMKPARFDSQVVSTISLESSKPSPSIMPQEKTFSPSSSPLDSLLAGERIQFGAVTSPTILPPVSRVVSNGIGAPGSSRSDTSKENIVHSMFFDKAKHPDESCAHLGDSEAEAEAAASAVAVAAISNNDEIVGNRISVCSVSDPKSFTGSDNTELVTSRGVAASQEVTGQSAAEESLTVSLPADLSVDTPSLPLWHPSPSAQSTSGPTLSHFHGGPHSHFPMGFDMNPIFGGPIFAFSQHDESCGTQPQPQRSNTLGSGAPPGAWPQCHSGVDSFYGPPAGFTGPFISPPGGIPGVQAPPHMVVYNHFPVGVSFMGATYIPTAKQPDWKHNPIPTSTVGVSEGEIVNANGSGQWNPPSMPAPIQHLAPGSPLLPMPSPLAMFDMPFQSSADIPYQACWSHVPAPPIHSVPLTMPPQHQQQQQQQQPSQQVDSGIPPQFTRGLPVDSTAANDRLNDRRSSDNNQNYSASKDSSHPFPDDLHLMDPPSTTSVQTIRPSYTPSRSSNTKGLNSPKNSSRNAAGVVNQESPSACPQQYPHPAGYGDQRGGASSHKGTAGGEWHRKMNYQGRGQASSSDKGFTPSKMKQIYVAKPPATTPATSN